MCPWHSWIIPDRWPGNLLALSLTSGSEMAPMRGNTASLGMCSWPAWLCALSGQDFRDPVSVSWAQVSHPLTLHTDHMRLRPGLPVLSRDVPRAGPLWGAPATEVLSRELCSRTPAERGRPCPLTENEVLAQRCPNFFDSPMSPFQEKKKITHCSAWKSI